MLLNYSRELEEFKTFVYFDIPDFSNSKLDIINYMFYLEGEHKISFDKDSLSAFFDNAGFKQFGVRAYDEKLDSFLRKKESLYFYGTK